MLPTVGTGLENVEHSTDILKLSAKYYSFIGKNNYSLFYLAKKGINLEMLHSMC